MDNINNTLYIIIIYDVSWFRSNLLIMKPIDFIPSQTIYESWFISLDQVHTSLSSHIDNYYSYSEDPKFQIFAKKHHLTVEERRSLKWIDMYLRLCAEGII